MNYAEQLASWYLRLNGFLLLPNFVLHKLELRQEGVANPLASTSDTDLLAIRHPYVFEDIGGQAHDWDASGMMDHLRAGIPAHERSDDLQSLLEPEKPVGLIVEVKGGSTRPTPRLHDVQVLRGVRRLGMLPADPGTEAAAELTRRRPQGEGSPPPFDHALGVIGTLLICQQQFVPDLRRERQYTHIVSLEHCERFIKHRFSRQRQEELTNEPNPKHRDRYFFPDELIQYLAWKAGLAHPDQEETL